MLKRVLVPIDGSDHAEKAINLASEIAKSCEAKVVLLHVWQPGPVPAELRHMAEVEHLAEPQATSFKAAAADVALSRVPVAMPAGEPGTNARILESLGETLLRSAENEVKAAGVSAVETALREGDPAEQILKCAQDQGVHLIAIGSRGLSSLQGLLMGSVSHKVTQLATCPVLVAK